MSEVSPAADGAVSLERDGGSLRVTGPLTMTTVPAAAHAAVVLDPGVQRIDLTRVSTVDSAAIALLLEWVRQGGSALRIDGAPDALRTLARLYALDNMLPLAAAAAPSS